MKKPNIVPVDLDKYRKMLYYMTRYFDEYLNSFSKEERDDIYETLLYFDRKMPAKKRLWNKGGDRRYLKVFGPQEEDVVEDYDEAYSES